MKLIAWIALAVSTAAACAVLAIYDERRADDAQAGTATQTAEIARLSAAVETLAAQQSEIAQAVDALRAAPSPLSEYGSARIPLGEIEAAVARALAAQPDRAAVAAAPAAVTPAAVAAKRDARAFIEALDDLSWDEQQALWKEIESGADLDEIIALYEERAARAANDPEAQVELGHAYLQKIFKTGGGPEAGVWAMKADGAYDKALKLDERNWEARFSKAMSLSHWPAVFGKQTEAIKHFEILVAQQESATSQPQFAQTHFLLGNMYQQIGDKAKALAAWQKGLSLFPNDAQLVQQIANLQTN